jgi:tetratricopeptide (TPR) repeat protein
MDPASLQTLRDRADLARRLGGARAAAEVFEKALAEHPGEPDLLLETGAGLYAAGEREKALSFLKEAARRRPGWTRALLILATTLEELGRHDEAAELFAPLADQKKDPRAEAYAAFHMAGIHLAGGAADKAAEICRRILARLPGDAAFRRLLLLACIQSGDHAGAVAAYDLLPNVRAERRADLAKLARSFIRLGDYTGFIRRFEALGDFSDGALLAAAAEVYNDAGLREKEEACQRRALALRPDDSALHSYELKTMTEADTVTEAEILAFAKGWDAKFGSPKDTPAFRDFPRPPRTRRRVRLGILSHSFRRHVTMTILRPLLPELAKRFDLYGYYDDFPEDAFTREAAGYFVQFRNTAALSEAAAAKAIHDDGLDALIDISGHFSGARTRILTYKPAPLVIHYADSSSTLGLSAVDCRFSDAIAEPPQWGDRYSTEKVLRLPHGFFLYQPLLDCGSPAPCPALENGFVTFGSCAALHKLTETTLALWKAALDAAPGSRLLLARDEFARDEGLRRLWRERFAQAGFDPERVTIVSGEKDDFVRLKFYAKIDIALDAFPYSGVTTTLDALWMGVPVVNYRETRFINRVCSSLLSRVGLSDLVTETREDFAAKAAALAADDARRRHLRETLRGAMQQSSLCDGAGMAADMERAILAELDARGI